MELMNEKVDDAPLIKQHIITVRFDGKNYQVWAHQVEEFLKQYDMAYVLTTPCPELDQDDLSNEEAELYANVVKRWVDDDNFCRGIILGSLSDRLWDKYTSPTTPRDSAKLVWEQLKEEAS